MENHPEETPTLPSSKTLFLGIQGFLLFTLAGLIIVFWWKAPASLKILWKSSEAPWLLALVPLLAVDYLIGGYRYRIFFDGKTLPFISLWDCMRSNWANIFMGAVTPGQTGGGPVQIYILWRCGAKVSEGALVSLINFAATLVFFVVGSIAAWLLLPSTLLGENFGAVVQTGLLIVGGMAALVLLALFFPEAGLAVVRFVFLLIPARLLKLQNLRTRLMTLLRSEILHFRQSFREILKRRKLAIWTILVATLLLYLNKYLMAYIIARAFGQHPDFGIFTGLQVVQYLFIYFAPTPGASGVAEVSTGWLLEKVISAEVVLYYAIAWRFFTTFLGAILGAVVLFFDLRTHLGIDASRKNPASG